jgi:hypothetical protein
METSELISDVTDVALNRETSLFIPPPPSLFRGICIPEETTHDDPQPLYLPLPTDCLPTGWHDSPSEIVGEPITYDSAGCLDIRNATTSGRFHDSNVYFNDTGDSKVIAGHTTVSAEDEWNSLPRLPLYVEPRSTRRLAVETQKTMSPSEVWTAIHCTLNVEGHKCLSKAKWELSVSLQNSPSTRCVIFLWSSIEGGQAFVEFQRRSGDVVAFFTAFRRWNQALSHLFVKDNSKPVIAASTETLSIAHLPVACSEPAAPTSLLASDVRHLWTLLFVFDATLNKTPKSIDPRRQDVFRCLIRLLTDSSTCIVAKQASAEWVTTHWETHSLLMSLLLSHPTSERHSTNLSHILEHLCCTELVSIFVLLDSASEPCTPFLRMCCARAKFYRSSVE